MTFSVVARCPRSGQLGVAVATAVPAVGSMCPFARAGVGAVSTQSWVNPYLALDALGLLRQGMAAADALAQVMAGDAGRELRQVGIIDAQGRSAAWSGKACTDWYGHIVEPGFAVQGNMLVSGATVDAMASAMRASEPLELVERLLLAMEAGEAAGGDKRGRQSASLMVCDTEDYPLIDLRVDEHHHPIAELRRVWGVAKLQLLPFVLGMPRKGGAGAPAPDHVVKMLGVPPPYRSGGGGSAP